MIETITLTTEQRLECLQLAGATIGRMTPTRAAKIVEAAGIYEAYLLGVAPQETGQRDAS